jgi:hypothetical protein
MLTYTTIGDLQVEGVIEHPPSLVPLEERDPDELTPVELREQSRLLLTAASRANVEDELSARNAPGPSRWATMTMTMAMSPFLGSRTGARERG